jgi:hypothetical protein
MLNKERVEVLEEAREHLEVAIALIENAVRGTKEQERARLYILGHLRSWLSRESTSIDNLIDSFGGNGEFGMEWTEEEFEELGVALLDEMPGLTDDRLDMILDDVRNNRAGMIDRYEPGDPDMLAELVKIYEE